MDTTLWPSKDQIHEGVACDQRFDYIRQMDRVLTEFSLEMFFITLPRDWYSMPVSVQMIYALQARFLHYAAVSFNGGSIGGTIVQPDALRAMGDMLAKLSQITWPADRSGNALSIEALPMGPRLDEATRTAWAAAQGSLTMSDLLWMQPTLAIPHIA